MLPPSENQLMPMWLPAVTARAIRAASGWYAATPRPESAKAIQVSAYASVSPDRAMPSPAAAMPPEISHGMGLRSVRAPKAGWTTQDSSVAASTMSETPTYP